MGTATPSFSAGFPTWQHAYAAALRETRLPRLLMLIEIAEDSMLFRHDILQGIPGSEAECGAISCALRALSAIKQKRFRFTTKISDLGMTADG